jgi:hypothetical protein
VKFRFACFHGSLRHSTKSRPPNCFPCQRKNHAFKFAEREMWEATTWQQRVGYCLEITGLHSSLIIWYITWAILAKSKQRALLHRQPLISVFQWVKTYHEEMIAVLSFPKLQSIQNRVGPHIPSKALLAIYKFAMHGFPPPPSWPWPHWKKENHETLCCKIECKPWNKYVELPPASLKI